MAAIVLGSLALNIYWFYLMSKMIVRVLGRMICPKKPSEDSIELVKADALADSGDYGGSSDEHGKEYPPNRRRDVVDELGGLEV